MSKRHHPRSILVRLPNWIGDACLSTPFLSELGRQLPNATVTALARLGPDAVARLAGVEDVLVLDDRGPLWTRSRALHREAAALRARRFDAAVTLAHTASSALLLWAAGIPKRVGYGRGVARFMLSAPLDWREVRGLHRAETYLRLLEGLGLQVPALTWEPPPVSSARRDAGEARLAPLGCARPRVGLGIGSAAASRRWPSQSWADLCRRLRGDLGAAVVLLGSPGDEPVAAAVRAHVEPDVLDLVGQTGVTEMPGLLSQLDLIVSNDSGLAHLAGLARVPTLVLFGAGDPRSTAPPWDGCRVLVHPVSCSPCLKNRCRFGLECLTGISPARVAAEAHLVLDRLGRLSREQVP